MSSRTDWNREPKLCEHCGNTFKPTGQNSKYCSVVCQKEHYKLNGKQQQYSSKYNKSIGKVVGVGSGGLTGSYKDNPMYKHGRYSFRNWAREYKKEIGLCMRCGCNIKDAPRGGWAGHHKDHNPTNNVKDNLEVLCKRCHQIEHECWKAFEGVTTISKESTDKCLEAPTSES